MFSQSVMKECLVGQNGRQKTMAVGRRRRRFPYRELTLNSPYSIDSATLRMAPPCAALHLFALSKPD
jgi:hypothetical protein